MTHLHFDRDGERDRAARLGDHLPFTVAERAGVDVRGVVGEWHAVR